LSNAALGEGEEPPFSHVLEERNMELEQMEGLLGEKREELQQKREEVSELNGERREYVVETLYAVQESLDEGEEVVLIDSEEWSRGGHYEFNEVLIHEGVVAREVERKFRRHGYTFEDGEKVQLNDSDVQDKYEIRGEDKYRDAEAGEMFGWSAEDEPLDIETEYITGRRETPEFIGKLSERLQNLEEGLHEVPSYGCGFD
jgi:hypothetical protein